MDLKVVQNNFNIYICATKNYMNMLGSCFELGCSNDMHFKRKTNVKKYILIKSIDTWWRGASHSYVACNRIGFPYLTITFIYFWSGTSSTVMREKMYWAARRTIIMTIIFGTLIVGLTLQALLKWMFICWENNHVFTIPSWKRIIVYQGFKRPLNSLDTWKLRCSHFHGIQCVISLVLETNNLYISPLEDKVNLLSASDVG